ncbi:MAG: PaaI family thioesterase [Woeseia sp.]
MSERPESFINNPTLYEGTYLQFLGFRLVDWRDGFARIEMPVRGVHRNTVGYLHGGVIASLLDIAGAVCGSYGAKAEFVSVTVNLNSTFITPHQGERVVVEGELIRRSNSLFFAQAKLYNPEKNILCAIATGTYKPRQREMARNSSANKAD